MFAEFHLHFPSEYASILTSVGNLQMKLFSLTTRRVAEYLCGSFYINLLTDKIPYVTFPRKQFPSEAWLRHTCKHKYMMTGFCAPFT
jgi:hypothetical protein